MTDELRENEQEELIRKTRIEATRIALERAAVCAEYGRHRNPFDIAAAIRAMKPPEGA